MAQELDSLTQKALSEKLSEYYLAMEREGTDVQKQECDFLIDAATDSLVRQYVALDIYDHYMNSPVMGSEAVAIHVLDNWFMTGKVKMKSEGNGYWTYTTAPLPSELYWYNFVVNDDTIKVDKQNPNIVRDINTLYNYFIVKGGIAEKYVDAKSKNGKLQYIWYPSSLEGMKQRRMAVYTPYDYDSTQLKQYPVLYRIT
jgi:hypothetical protein